MVRVYVDRIDGTIQHELGHTYAPDLFLPEESGWYDIEFVEGNDFQLSIYNQYIRIENHERYMLVCKPEFEQLFNLKGFPCAKSIRIVKALDQGSFSPRRPGFTFG